MIKSYFFYISFGCDTLSSVQVTKVCAKGVDEISNIAFILKKFHGKAALHTLLITLFTCFHLFVPVASPLYKAQYGGLIYLQTCENSMLPVVAAWEPEISVITVIPGSACRTHQSIYNQRWCGGRIFSPICLKNQEAGLWETLNNWSNSLLWGTFSIKGGNSVHWRRETDVVICACVCVLGLG